MFGVNSINGSIQWLVVPAPLRNNGPPWNDTVLALIPAWVTGGTANNPNWGSQPGEPYGIVAVPWSGPIRAMTAYIHRSPENARSAGRRLRDDILRKNRTARMQSFFTSRIILRNSLVNQQDWDWNHLWDELVDQEFVWRISVGNVSISEFSFLSVNCVSSYL